MGSITPDDILSFWKAAGYERWFKKDDAFDNAIRSRFSGEWEAAASGARDGWKTSDEGSLALTILLDQFPRNLHRDTPNAFATDEAARTVAIHAIDRGMDLRVDPVLRPFFYLPFMHSEDPADQARSVSLYEALGDAEQLRYAREHRDLIVRFGRFPHRNDILGRQLTAEERAYLDGGGFKG